jgi:hypothetical protein
MGGSLDDDTKKKLLKRLRKILALVDSSNPGEAAAALHQANNLMAKHGLSAMDAQTSSVEEVELTLRAATVSRADNYLMGVVTKALGVIVYIRRFEKHPGYKRPPATVIFIGESHMAQIAVYAFETLRKKMHLNMRDAFADLIETAGVSIEDRKLCKMTPKQKDAYAFGWCAAIKEKVAALAPSVPVSVQEHFKLIESRLAPGSTRKRFQLDSLGSHLLRQGSNDGKSVDLNKGVNMGVGNLAIANS